MNALISNYARFPLTLIRGSGSRVWDDQGQEYLDFVAGIAVNTLGHAHPALTAAIADQASTMLHCSNLYHIPLQEQLAETLCTLSGLDGAFFCNSGAEANEAAIKLARKFFHDQGSARRSIITATASFHGRTMLTLTATGQDKVKQGFDPLPAGFAHVPLNDLDALEHTIDAYTAAILLEPLQGEGGVNIADPSYLRAVRRLCDRHGILLILDEIQTGIGRTGTMFAYEQADIRPDILTLAKGLGGGVPIGAMLATASVAAAFGPGSHGSTFGGNPLACRAALTVLNVMKQQQLLAHVQQCGTRLQTGLQELQTRFPLIAEVRGYGLLQGIALHEACAVDIIREAQAEGLLVLSAGPTVVRLIPALNITFADIDEGLHRLGRAIQRASAGA